MSFEGFPYRIASCPVVTRDASTLVTAFAGAIAGVAGEHPAKTTAKISRTHIDVARMDRTLLAGHYPASWRVRARWDVRIRWEKRRFVSACGVAVRVWLSQPRDGVAMRPEPS